MDSALSLVRLTKHYDLKVACHWLAAGFIYFAGLMGMAFAVVSRPA